MSNETITKAVEAAYIRGAAWMRENPDFPEYVNKAACDYTDNFLSALQPSPAREESNLQMGEDLRPRFQNAKRAASTREEAEVRERDVVIKRLQTYIEGVAKDTHTIMLQYEARATAAEARVQELEKQLKDKS